MFGKRSWLICAGLGLVWVAMVGWQYAEHSRVSAAARAALLDRAKDISTSLGVVLRSQRMFVTVSPPRLERALGDLAGSSELLSVALLNPVGEVIASGGEHIPESMLKLSPGETRWGRGTLTVSALVELGADAEPGGPRPGPPIEAADEKAETAVLWSPPGPSGGGERRPPPDDEDEDEMRPPGREPSGEDLRRPGPREAVPGNPEDGARGAPRGAPPPEAGESGERPEGELRGRLDSRRRPDPGEEQERRERHRAFWRHVRENHPFWMSGERFRELYEKQGLHKFLLVMSSRPTEQEIGRDGWLRLIVSGGALLAVVGLGAAGVSFDRSSRLQIRLVRTRAMNAYLRELNLAAAGLAHETRNPLNIVRGMTQMIAKEAATVPAIRDRATVVLGEVDRVTSRLNEFIEYSRPHEPVFAATDIAAVVKDVEAALNDDFAEKSIRFTVDLPPVRIRADESMLRQVVFNLLLNALQAVDAGGSLSVQGVRDREGSLSIEICDDGPGIPPDARESIFRPYFSLSDKGTGLGLAVVRRIALAHDWDIEYSPREPRGSIFRIRGVSVVRETT